MNSKSIFLSKTFWANVGALGAMVIQHYTGYVINPETQAVAWAVLNVALRFFTKQPVTVV